MKTKIQKWGNSKGIRIPNEIIKELDYKVEDELEISRVEDKIVMYKPVKQKKSIKEMFENYQGEDLTKEFSWDKPRGREIW